VDQPADLSAGRRGAGGEPAIGRVLATAVAAVVALALAGCGGGRDSSRESSRDFDRLEAHGVDKLAELERFVRIRIPASATAVHSYFSSSMDTTVYVGLRLARSAVRTFVRDGRFQGPLKPGYRAVFDGEGKELGWHLSGPAKVAGLEEIQAGLGRNLMVVFDDAQRPAVYLSATTL
jgi:hypothetical protein